MYIGSGIKRSGDFLQDAQGHQSSITPPENIPGEPVMQKSLRATWSKLGLIGDKFNRNCLRQNLNLSSQI